MLLSALVEGWSTLFRDLVAFPRIEEMDGVPDGGDEEEHRREARTGGQRLRKRRVVSSKRAEATGSVEETFEAEAEEGTACASGLGREYFK